MMPIGATGIAERPERHRGRLQQHRRQRQPDRPDHQRRSPNFGWEYVFHCHILSHEEMDMMRPVTVHVASSRARRTGALVHPRQRHPQLDGRHARRLRQPGHLEQSRGNEIGFRDRTGRGRRDGTAGAFAADRNGAGEQHHLHRRPARPDAHLRLPGHRLQRGRRLAVERRSGSRGCPAAPTGADGGRAARRRPAGRLAGRARAGRTTRPTRPASSSSAPSAPERSACWPRWLRPPRATSIRRSCPAPTATGCNAVNAVGPSAYAGPVTVTVPQPASTTVVVSSLEPVRRRAKT